MNQKTFSAIVAPIFLIIAVLHILRIVYGWTAVIGGWMLPLWLSWAALVISAYLAYTGFRLSKS